MLLHSYVSITSTNLPSESGAAAAAVLAEAKLPPHGIIVYDGRVLGFSCRNCDRAYVMSGCVLGVLTAVHGPCWCGAQSNKVGGAAQHACAWTSLQGGARGQG